MNRSKFMRRLLGGISVVATVAAITFSGCTNIDNKLGSNLTQQDQALKLGQLNINGADGNFFESRLYITDSIKTSNLSSGYFGTMGNDTFGVRNAGFFTQYIAANSVEDDLFGYKPIFDSAVLFLSVNGYRGDTTIKQRFDVFEVVDNSFLQNLEDTTFFGNFEIDKYIASEPVFTFEYPNADKGVYTASTYVKMDETPLTAEFMNRIMLKDDPESVDIYTNYKEWVNKFKGLYIRPHNSLDSYVGKDDLPAIFSTSTENSGWGFYGRSREEADPTLIKDTIGMTYIFKSTQADAGNVSIGIMESNYDNSLINLDDVKTIDKSDDEVPLTSTLRVEGMAGVVSEITMTDEFFKELDKIFEIEEQKSGDVYTSLFFNQAKLKIYMQEVTSQDPADIDPLAVTPWMNVMPTSLGLYNHYASYNYTEDGDTRSALIGISDYLYAYESSYTLDFGGGLNRSWGCYVMNIPGQMQAIWNGYLEVKEKAEKSGKAIDYEAIPNRKMYLAPTASNLFSTKYASLQASDPTANTAPFTLELTYTMIR